MNRGLDNIGFSLYLSITARGAKKGSLFVRRVAILKVWMVTFHRATQLRIIRLALDKYIHDSVIIFTIIIIIEIFTWPK